MIKLVLSLLAAGCLLRADFDPAHWQFRQPVQVQQAAAVSAFVVDSGVYRESLAGLADLRIVRGERDLVEVPYQLEVLSGSREEVELPATLRNKAFVPGEGVQVVLDAGGHAEHNRVRISTSQKNFKQGLRVETSDDSKNWAVVQDDGLIFDVSQADRQVSDLTVEYPASTRRYVRLTIPGWQEPAYLESAWLSHFKESNAVRDVLSTLVPVVEEDDKTRATSFLFDIGFQGLPYDRLDVKAKPGFFARSLEVWTSGDQKAWTLAGEGVLSRTAERERLQIQVPEQWNRYLKLRVFNEDNPPLALERVMLSAPRRVVKFPSTTSGAYWLYAGNHAARQPGYDFGQVIPAKTQAMPVALGAIEANAGYRAMERPWTDRNPWLLNLVLVLAVALMGLVTVRFLMKVKAG